MHTEAFSLIGSGGHAKVVLDALWCGHTRPDTIVVRDDNPALAGTFLLGLVIATPAVPEAVANFHVAIGDNRIRDRLNAACCAVGGVPITIAHPRSIIAIGTTIAAGCFIAAGAVIGPDTEIGAGVIVNHGAVVDHDCRIGHFAHIGPNATLGGGVSVGTRVLVGSGATVLPGIAIGDDAVIGAGSVVHQNVPAGETRVGVPAKSIGRPQP